MDEEGKEWEEEVEEEKEMHVVPELRNKKSGLKTWSEGKG